MAPTIDLGGIFWTSGGALTRQAAARRDKGQEKKAKNDPRAVQERQEAILDDFWIKKDSNKTVVGGVGWLDPRVILSL